MTGDQALHQKLVVEYRPLSEIRPYEKNARKIPQAAVDAVAKSLREFGWQQPIVVDAAGVIIVGHVRRLAAIQEGMTEAPVVVAAHLTPAQVRQYRLMDNRSHDEAKWDADILTAELLDMRALDLDLSLTGFSSGELDRLLLQPNAGEDDVPPVPDAPVSRLGDLWLCGEHRVCCGDATNAENTATVIRDATPFLMVTDPPYGVSYDPSWRVKAAEEGHLDYAPTRVGEVSNDDRTDWAEAWNLFPGDVIYCWSPPGSNSIVSGSALLGSGFDIRNMIIWSKPHFPIGRGNYHYRHEPCWYAVRHGKPSHWCGDRTQTTVWEVALDKNVEGGHSTQKPVELMRRPIKNHTLPGDSVYDPFLGSGTTLIAAELTGRICYGLEISPAYCDVIVARWEKLTGKQATLDGNGSTFEHVRHSRSMEAVA
jgi:DNA modification methylase